MRHVRNLARELETECLAPSPSPKAEAVLASFRDQLAELSSFRRLAPLLSQLADETDHYMIACTPGANLDDIAEQHRDAALQALHNFRRRTAWAIDNIANNDRPRVRAGFRA